MKCPRECHGELVKSDSGWYRCNNCENKVRESVIERRESFENVAFSGGPASDVAKAALGLLNEEIDPRYVYAIRDDEGYVKIGKSKHPKKRCRELSTGTPKQLELLAKAKVDRAGRLERKLHDDFSEFHERGEWYDLDEQGIQRLIEELN